MPIRKLVKKIKHRKLFAFGGLILAILISCASTASNNSGGLSKPPYTGTGGKGMSLAILAPKATGLAKEQDYIPSLVQGEFVSNFSGYSAISVLDRVKLDDQYAELLSGYYDDTAQANRDLGHLTPTDYIMGGNITRTATGYAMQISVTKSADKMTAASYSGTFTFAELDNLSGVRRASLDLLQKMGVQLTDKAMNELDKPGSTQAINAQTNLAQGITAQRKGTVVEAMAYYYNAVSFDPKLSEANGRLSTLSSNISSGNIGENVRNDIQRRKAWLDILKECEDYFTKHPPYEIVYHTKLTQGRIDYQNETVDLSSSVEIILTNAFQIVNDILKGLAATGKKEEWGVAYWPLRSDAFVDIDRYWYDPNYGSDFVGKIISINFQLISDHGKIIAVTDWHGFAKINFANLRPNLHQYEWDERVISQIRVTDNIFENVNANDITDNLTIKVVSVNGIDIAKNTDYIKITTR